MSTSHSSKPVIISAMLANFFIAIMKLVVVIFTGSSAMLAEAIHSIADTTNQIFLLVVEINNLIDGIEKEIREKFPDVKKIFIEPDIYSEPKIRRA